MEKMETEEDLEKWNELVSNFKNIDWSKFTEAEDYTDHKGIIACANGKCEV